LQILTLTTKLLTISPATSQLLLLSTYLFNLARYDMDYDVRDRARFLNALLRGVRAEKQGVANGEGTDEEEEEDQGGVVLRREQVSVVLLGKREAGDAQITGE
jgi:AP-3 complex subunit beta